MTPRRTLEVLPGWLGVPAGALEGRACFVIDVLRACTTIAYALDAGARGVIPVETVEDATRLAQTLDRDSTLLCGERGNLRIEGFALGNSPAEYTPEVVADKTLVLSTSNGAGAFARLRGARSGAAAAFVNLTACARRAAREEHVTVICAGAGSGLSLEDFVCAGFLVEALLREGRAPKTVLDDGARTARETAARHAGDLAGFLRSTDHGRDLVAGGFAADLDLAARVDRFDCVPELRDGRLVPARVDAAPGTV